MSTTKTASKKPATQKAVKTVKAAPKVKEPPVKIEAKAEPAKTETVEPEVVETEHALEPAPDKPIQPKRPTSDRYEIACLEVSTVNRAFLDALRERCDQMHTCLKGESCGIRDATPEMIALNKELKTVREKMRDLLQQRRELMKVSPELEAINEKIRGLRRQRSVARAEKKAAAAEIGL